MMMHSRFILFTCTLVAASWLCGCATTRVNQDPAFVGQWVSPTGENFNVQADEKLGNVIVARRSDGTMVTCGQILSVDGKTMAQIRVIDIFPSASPSDELNLYSFGVLEQNGDVLLHRPIRPEWFAAHARQHQVRYIRTDTAKPGTGVAIASRPQDLTAVLRAALADPTALAPAERFTRSTK